MVIVLTIPTPMFLHVLTPFRLTGATVLILTLLHVAATIITAHLLLVPDHIMHHLLIQGVTVHHPLPLPALLLLPLPHAVVVRVHQEGAIKDIKYSQPSL